MLNLKIRYDDRGFFGLFGSFACSFAFFFSLVRSFINCMKMHVSNKSGLRSFPMKLWQSYKKKHAEIEIDIMYCNAQFIVVVAPS